MPGIILGINRGFTLEDHPQHLTKPPLIGTAAGSAGIPDSLGHKPVETSGGPDGQDPTLLSTSLPPHFSPAP